MRKANIERNTLETQIKLELNIDGCGKKNIQIDIPFFKHMLEQFAAHGYFDIDLTAKSLDGDIHHSVEDVAIVLGQAFKEALGDKKGINRYGNASVPMDEALVLTAIDLSGRAYSNTDLNIKEEKTGDFDTILVKHFFSSFAANSLSTIHIKSLYGDDTHHVIEAAFKSFARALKAACEIDEKHKDITPSTKGVL
ncbi:MAG: imidazoleglycerol-phosphate dehydratase HisB [bacterium]|nr:imidazoleglycerol-phosphate dehydratase HisB [bacterium]